MKLLEQCVDVGLSKFWRSASVVTLCFVAEMMRVEKIDERSHLLLGLSAWNILVLLHQKYVARYELFLPSKLRFFFEQVNNNRSQRENKTQMLSPPSPLPQIAAKPLFLLQQAIRLRLELTTSTLWILHKLSSLGFDVSGALIELGDEALQVKLCFAGFYGLNFHGLFIIEAKRFLLAWRFGSPIQLMIR